MLVELGYFDKHFVKTQEKEAPQGNSLEIFVLNTVKTQFWLENLTHRWKQSGHFFSVFKKSRGGLLSFPSLAPVSVSK